MINTCINSVNYSFILSNIYLAIHLFKLNYNGHYFIIIHNLFLLYMHTNEYTVNNCPFDNNSTK